jgi:phage-related protein
MALLDTLLLVFKADTSQADAGLDSARKKSDELIDSIRNADDVAGKAGASFKAMAAGALGGLAAAFSVSAAISGAFSRADDIRAIEQTSEAIGAAIENVDAFGKAAEAMGGDAQGARDSLTDMAEKMGEAMTDVESGAAKAFKSLGIGLKNTDGSSKDAISGILDLAGAVEGLDKSSAVFKIKELGITDNRTVEMVLKGRQELERLLRVQKEQGVITKQSAENARKLTEAMGSLQGGLRGAGNSFLDSIIPALTKVIEWLSKGVSWMQDNKDFVVGFFGAIAAVVAAVYLPAMIAAAAATLAATWPFIAIGVAIAAAAAAFALIYDDVMNFIDGNDSFIGQVFEKYPMVERIVMSLIDVFKALWDMLIIGAQQIGNVVSLGFQQVISGIKAAVDYLTEAYSAIQSFVDSSLSAFQSMSDGISAIFSFIVDTVKSSMSFVTAGIDKIKSGVSGVAGFFGFGDSSEAMGSAGQQLGMAARSPSNGVTSSAISNSAQSSSEQNIQIGQVTVQTNATDAQGMASGAKSELQNQLKNLEHESATGVDR